MCPHWMEKLNLAPALTDAMLDRLEQEKMITKLEKEKREALLRPSLGPAWKFRKIYTYI